MEIFFTADSRGNADGKIFALTGMGGAGKTQICLKFAETFSEGDAKRCVSALGT